MRKEIENILREFARECVKLTKHMDLDKADRLLDKTIRDIEILTYEASGFTKIRKTLESTYIPHEMEDEDIARKLSGRLIEEAVELHLESGGDHGSLFGHILDAIANESLKRKNGGGSYYPSSQQTEYNRKEVIREMLDIHMHLINMHVALKLDDETEVNPLLDEKLGKITTALKEGRLHRTSPLTFYIRKGE